MKLHRHRIPLARGSSEPAPRKNRSLRKYIEALERKIGRKASDISLEEVRSMLAKVGPISPLIREMRDAR